MPLRWCKIVANACMIASIAVVSLKKGAIKKGAGLYLVFPLLSLLIKRQSLILGPAPCLVCALV